MLKKRVSRIRDALSDVRALAVRVGERERQNNEGLWCRVLSELMGVGL